MSLPFRDVGVRSETSPDMADRPASPPAVRQRPARWRDPRLWLGVVLVLGSIAIGARVLAAGDDTVAMWQVAHDIPAGSHVGQADLRVTRVHFEQPAVATAYVPVRAPFAPTLRALRDLHAGEMLQVAAVTSRAADPVRQLPLGVSAAHEPADLRAGDHVQVWAVRGQSSVRDRAGPRPMLVLPDVTVLSVGGNPLGASADRQVLVSLGAGVDVGAVLTSTTGASVVLVRLAG